MPKLDVPATSLRSTHRVVPSQRPASPGPDLVDLPSGSQRERPLLVRLWRRQAQRPWVRAGIAGAAAWVAIHAAYAVVTLFVGLHAPSTLGDYHPTTGYLVGFRSWFRWDAWWYVDLGRRGYGPPFRYGDARGAAFFPMYPALIRVTAIALFGKFRLAAVVISNLALLGVLVLLYRLTERERSTAAAGRAIWYLLAFPAAFFLAAPYPTAVFLLFAIGSCYAMRTGRWWLAGLLAGLASATRPSGLLLALPFCYEYLRQHDLKLRRVRWDALALALVPAGLFAFMLYTWAVLGDAWAFLHAQRHWTRGRSAPWISVSEAVRVAWRSHLIHDPINALELGSVLLVAAGLGLAFFGPWRLRRDQLALPIFGVAQLLLLLSFPPAKLIPTEPLLSASRQVLDVFPAFMMLGMGLTHRFVAQLYAAVGLSLQGLLLLHYLHGGWVA